jgi:hypothetical protein
MEDDLNFLKMEDDLKFLKMEEDVKKECNQNLLKVKTIKMENGRRPQYFFFKGR